MSFAGERQAAYDTCLSLVLLPPRFYSHQLKHRTHTVNIYDMDAVFDQVAKKPKILPEPKCELLGPVSIFIQTCLGLIAMSSLVLKRYYEHPKRPWKVWLFDVSKQVLGSLGIHLLNLFVSLFKSKVPIFGILMGSNDGTIGGSDGDGDGDLGDIGECDWYFLNLLMDTTIGVPILYISLVMVYSVCEYFQIQGIESGNYGKPPQYIPYFKQLAIFFMAVIMMKCILYLLLYFPIFAIYADWVLSWSDGFPNLQIVLVMLVFPIMLNCFQYYVVDNLIKFPTTL
ncbi:CYFA0S13e01354g1_1 [Cyberlindnera fabianii]|uniref:CYFA0S13e01354g1_1 n=1 Tax=Cyberlindnera fabianii TaxID=36022 RepID=A0A061B3G7_CYBFA|nr:CYFA0S13e01354g1_1 [Cyberlindnera fabianii]